jgi:hypothetical protein
MPCSAASKWGSFAATPGQGQKRDFLNTASAQGRANHRPPIPTACEDRVMETLKGLPRQIMLTVENLKKRTGAGRGGPRL